MIKLGRLGQVKEDATRNSAENDGEGEEEEGQAWGRKSNISLLDQHTELKKLAAGKYLNISFLLLAHNALKIYKA